MSAYPGMTNLKLPAAGWSGVIKAGSCVMGWFEGKSQIYALPVDVAAEVEPHRATEYDGLQRAVDPQTGQHLFWVQGGNAAYPLDAEDYQRRFAARDKELGL